MIPIKETRKLVVKLKLDTKDLQLMLQSTKTVLEYYKGIVPVSDDCEFCANSLKIATSLIGGHSDYVAKTCCDFCPWKLFEGRSCVNWYKGTYSPLFSLNFIKDFGSDPEFCKVRIKMLHKWIRRLNALAATRRF